jgi:hypothetical protein
MDDAQFEALRAEIDQAIDAHPDAHARVTMGFGLAGEFLIRNWLATLHLDVVGFPWETRTCRDRFVYPDPMLGEFDYIVG